MTLLSINERSRLTWTARSPRRSPRSAARRAADSPCARRTRRPAGRGRRRRARSRVRPPRERARRGAPREAAREAGASPARRTRARTRSGPCCTRRSRRSSRSSRGGWRGRAQSRRQAEIRMVGYHVRREKVFFRAIAYDSFYSIINMGVFVFVRDETHHALREDSSSLVACRGSAASRAERRANAARDGQKQKQKQKQKDARFASITTRWRRCS